MVRGSGHLGAARMPEFTIPDFNRRYVLIPMLLAIALVVGAYFVTEARRSLVMTTADTIRHAQDSMRTLTELAYVAADAESSQRGYLLTQNKEYLDPYNAARKKIGGLVAALRAAYQANPIEAPHVARLADLINKKLVEMNATLTLEATTGAATESVQLMNTDVGMSTLR